MRYDLAYMKQTEEVFTLQFRSELEKQLYRRANKLGSRLAKPGPKPVPTDEPATIA